MESAQARVQESVSSLISKLDKQHLRKMQAEMYRCSTKCCEDNSKTLDEVQNCIESCGERVNRAQNYVQTEMQNFQNRLQRCAMDCQDKIRDKVPPGASNDEILKYKAELEKCVVGCANTHVDLMQQMGNKMNETLSKGKF